MKIKLILFGSSYHAQVVISEIENLGNYEIKTNVYGTPDIAEDSGATTAYTTLKLLSGKNHKVLTGVTLIYNDRIHTFHDTTIVSFLKLKDSDIQKYINSDAPYDKAGSYGIQDYSAIFVKKINGCYDNVMGFPLSKFYNELKKINLEL